MLTFDEYEKAAMRTNGTSGTEQITNAALGLAGEAGEVCELVKKCLFHGHPLSVSDMENELGDVLWYVAQMCDALGIPMDRVASGNIAKLRQRYPDGFSSERSINRVGYE